MPRGGRGHAWNRPDNLSRSRQLVVRSRSGIPPRVGHTCVPDPGHRGSSHRRDLPVGTVGHLRMGFPTPIDRRFTACGDGERSARSY
jgi:hypothetical protein